MLFVAAFSLSCESSAGGDYPDCDVSRLSQVSFEALDADDQLTIVIQGSPCYEASLMVSISSADGSRLYEYEARFKPHVASQWDDSDLDEDAERLADQLVDPESFGLTSDLPPWLPGSEYYEENHQNIKISKQEYEELRRRDWITFTHSVHFEGWRVVAFDQESRRSIVVSEGTL